MTRFPVARSGKTFAENDIVLRGPGGERGTVLRVHALNGHCEKVDVEWHGPHVDAAGVGRPRVECGVSPRFLVLVTS